MTFLDAAQFDLFYSNSQALRLTLDPFMPLEKSRAFSLYSDDFVEQFKAKGAEAGLTLIAYEVSTDDGLFRDESGMVSYLSYSSKPPFEITTLDDFLAFWERATIPEKWWITCEEDLRLTLEEFEETLESRQELLSGVRANIEIHVNNRYPLPADSDDILALAQTIPKDEISAIAALLALPLFRTEFVVELMKLEKLSEDEAVKYLGKDYVAKALSGEIYSQFNFSIGALES